MPADHPDRRGRGPRIHPGRGGFELGRINVAARGVGIAEARGSPPAIRRSARPSASRSASTRRSSSSSARWRRAPAARLATLDAGADAFDRGERCDLEAGMAKYFSSEGRAREQHRIDAHPRRLRLPKEYDIERFTRRAMLNVHRRGHQRDAAHHHRPAMDRGTPSHERPICPRSPASGS